jgi:hypothetical protein
MNIGPTHPRISGAEIERPPSRIINELELQNSANAIVDSLLIQPEKIADVHSTILSLGQALKELPPDTAKAILNRLQAGATLNAILSQANKVEKNFEIINAVNSEFFREETANLKNLAPNNFAGVLKLLKQVITKNPELNAIVEKMQTNPLAQAWKDSLFDWQKAPKAETEEARGKMDADRRAIIDSVFKIADLLCEKIGIRSSQGKSFGTPDVSSDIDYEMGFHDLGTENRKPTLMENISQGRKAGLCYFVFRALFEKSSNQFAYTDFYPAHINTYFTPSITDASAKQIQSRAETMAYFLEQTNLVGVEKAKAFREALAVELKSQGYKEADIAIFNEIFLDVQNLETQIGATLAHTPQEYHEDLVPAQMFARLTAKMEALAAEIEMTHDPKAKEEKEAKLLLLSFLRSRFAPHSFYGAATLDVVEAQFGQKGVRLLERKQELEDKLAIAGETEKKAIEDEIKETNEKLEDILSRVPLSTPVFLASLIENGTNYAAGTDLRKASKAGVRHYLATVRMMDSLLIDSIIDPAIASLGSKPHPSADELIKLKHEFLSQPDYESWNSANILSGVAKFYNKKLAKYDLKLSLSLDHITGKQDSYLTFRREAGRDFKELLPLEGLRYHSWRPETVRKMSEQAIKRLQDGLLIDFDAALEKIVFPQGMKVTKDSDLVEAFCTALNKELRSSDLANLWKVTPESFANHKSGTQEEVLDDLKAMARLKMEQILQERGKTTLSESFTFPKSGSEVSRQKGASPLSTMSYPPAVRASFALSPALQSTAQKRASVTRLSGKHIRRLSIGMSSAMSGLAISRTDNIAQRVIPDTFVEEHALEHVERMKTDRKIKTTGPKDRATDGQLLQALQNEVSLHSIKLLAFSLNEKIVSIPTKLTTGDAASISVAEAYSSTCLDTSIVKEIANTKVST